MAREAVDVLRKQASQLALLFLLAMACTASSVFAQVPIEHSTTIEKSAPNQSGVLRHFKSVRTSEGDTPDAASGPGFWHQRTTVEEEAASEAWVGFEGYRRVASLYSGATLSPFGNLRQDGFRLRIVAGGSLYSYGGRRHNPALDQSEWVNFSGMSRFGDLLAGWQFSLKDTTIKVFAGRGQVAHLIAPYDVATAVQGHRAGLKGVLEIWHNWTPQLWSSIDVSAAGAHRAHSAQLRTGWRLGDGRWSLGPEIGQTGHVETNLRRAGAFVRFEDLTHEFSLSAGAMQARGDSPTGYGAAQYLRRF